MDDIKGPKPIDIDKDDLPDIDHDQIQYGTSLNRVKRGEEVSVTTIDPTLKNITIGLGWDMRAFDEELPDLDACVFLLDKNGKTRENEDFVFYNNSRDTNGSVKHTGDNRTGAGEGDDETIQIDLNLLSYEIIRLVFVVSIYDEELKGHNFSLVKNVYFRLVNDESQQELFRYELDEDMPTKGEAIIVGTLERIGPEWVFRAVGDPIEGGLAKIATDYDIVIAEMQ